ncbi:ubiquinone biosynthesis protein COQ4 [Pendulispora rubella]|uniref:Ubiquinone biosynthesis protein COQ4 n=1 Tax=Pendulispora rubella TaxID=2741070 RepID=A0ABZ2KR86_9BACT
MAMTTIQSDGYDSVQEMVETYPLWKRFVLGVRTLRVIADDPHDSNSVQLFSMCVNANGYSDLSRRFEESEGGRRLLRERPVLDGTTMDFDALAALPEGTLGHQLAHVFRSQNLKTFMMPKQVRTKVEFVAQRMLQTHDIWHVVADYRMDLIGELELQGFLLGQHPLLGHLMASVLGVPYVVFVGARRPFDPPVAGAPARLGMREVYNRWTAAYARGKAARFGMALPWEDYWSTPLEAIREELGLTKKPARAPAVA